MCFHFFGPWINHKIHVQDTYPDFNIISLTEIVESSVIYAGQSVYLLKSILAIAKQIDTVFHKLLNVRKKILILLPPSNTHENVNIDDYRGIRLTLLQDNFQFIEEEIKNIHLLKKKVYKMMIRYTENQLLNVRNKLDNFTVRVDTILKLISDSENYIYFF